MNEEAKKEENEKRDNRPIWARPIYIYETGGYGNMDEAVAYDLNGSQGSNGVISHKGEK